MILREDVYLAVDPNVKLGSEGDEVNIIDKRGHVLIVQHVTKLSNPFSITTEKISYDRDEDNNNKRRTKENSQRVQRERAKGVNRNVGASNKKTIPKQPVSDGQILFSF
ncbi:hypothetical protein ORI89_18710 [Sphingobacterium sp. UT-1RO-CII-1]|uniref:hypothetical protein n=1 Tax=Sphingobacterium sp. UT-1RO-CII-1 TaxID=2995225 RepID=UPI00227A5103|nr:hypothetical protein [Sphingobacterium sp. UT-1RO-CII-1]MCY4781689.1 hypothetical protein [Sphingobacterium sp. UT-1RO-CII-1]